MFMKQHPKFLALEKFLRRLDSGRKVESEVAQIMADVNKYKKQKIFSEKQK